MGSLGEEHLVGKEPKDEESKLYLILTYSILMTTSAKCLHVILVHLQENFSDCILNAIFKDVINDAQTVTLVICHKLYLHMRL